MDLYPALWKQWLVMSLDQAFRPDIDYTNIFVLSFKSLLYVIQQVTKAGTFSNISFQRNADKEKKLEAE